MSSNASTCHPVSTPTSSCEPEHHHHVICSNCGRSADIDDRGIRAATRKIAKRTGYRIDTHRVELFGLCPTCAAAAR